MLAIVPVIAGVGRSHGTPNGRSGRANLA